MKLYSILILALLLAVPAGLPSCQTQPVVQQPVNITNTTQVIAIPDTIRIASFNIQVFGQDKMSDAEVVDILKKIVRKFDIIAIQEIRDATETTIPEFVRQLNSMPGGNYSYIISERLGRTTSKEQYVFLYKTNMIRNIDYYTYPDDKDLFEREPHIGKFSAGQFDFVLINIHTKPDNAISEIGDLDRVMDDAKTKYPDEGDFIVLGDLNADCSYFPDGTNSNMREQQYQWVVEDYDDTTTRSTTCAYDRFIFLKESTGPDYTGQYGIFDFKAIYGLSEDLADRVSDHRPIWAEFYTDKDDD